MAYDPVGALNGLFAPAYIHGNAESDQAVQNWMVAHPRSPGVGTFVPNATAAATPVAQPLAPAADTQRNNIAAAVQQQATPPTYYGQGGVVPTSNGGTMPVMGGYDSLGVTPPSGMISQPYGGLGLSDWNTFVGHVGLDAANKWASQQFVRAPQPPTYTDSYGGGSS